MKKEYLVVMIDIIHGGWKLSDKLNAGYELEFSVANSNNYLFVLSRKKETK